MLINDRQKPVDLDHNLNFHLDENLKYRITRAALGDV
jgi:hypothetical protein